MSKRDLTRALEAVATRVEETFAKAGVQLTLGGEPTYVPVHPEGAEWSITALGPTKLRYAHAMAEALIGQRLPQAVAIYTPGKQYPGEVNPRWALNLVWNRDGTPLAPALAKVPRGGASPTRTALNTFCERLLTALGLKRRWLRARDPLQKGAPVWVLPLDHDGRRFTSARWPLPRRLELLGAEGPAGLRLPLSALPAELSRRALTIEIKDGRLHIFLPPLLQRPFLALLSHLARTLSAMRLGPAVFAGYLPPDTSARWSSLALASDPGVLEINLPPCPTWRDYRDWLAILERAASSVGLRSFKQLSPEETAGTGGGNHLLFGGPSLETNALFLRPSWVTSILRYWQHHPALAYLFTGQYVGPSSQAPRPDESASDLYDLEIAYQFLEQLPVGDHRQLLGETLRHLHIDRSGNTHRSEISFDKFWSASFDGGCRGLIEFRAIESLPRAEWMSAIALLWKTLAAWLLGHPFPRPLVEHGDRLHDEYFLPTRLWKDFEAVLRDLCQGGFALPVDAFREIFEWRFPMMLNHRAGGEWLIIRKAHEGWPLLCETPLEGGSTSRFVDTSIERLEVTASRALAERCELFVQGRRLPLTKFEDDQFGAGLRYRRTALYPSLHPGIAVHLPLSVMLQGAEKLVAYRLVENGRRFEQIDPSETPALSPTPCKTLKPELLTYDLRIA